MAIGNSELFNATNIAATTLIRTGPGMIRGILVNSSTAGTATIYDGVSAGGTRFTNATTLNAGSFVTFPVAFATGLYIVIGGTADVTVLWIPS